MAIYLVCSFAVTANSSTPENTTKNWTTHTTSLSVARSCSTSTLMLITSHAKLFTPKPLTNGHTTTSFKVPRERGKAEFDPSSTIVVLDLRSTDDFSHLRLPNAINFPIGRTRNPYQHPPTMVEQFKFIDSRIGAEAKDDIEFGDEVLGGKVVFMLGYDGHSARLAMSVLKNRGLEAYCVMGGVVEWERVGLAPFGVKN
ncbi:hypothetical protein FS749_011908 [Ceratobasidium sp. UAMH 11750]|nr:hypothetical protein FS749_011908 [Ceratobasidium sp. UAMH 11750]